MMITEGGVLHEQKEIMESGDSLSAGVWVSNICVCGNL